MGKVWVLDSETKGTGAQMVPLEKVLQKPEPKPAARQPAQEARPAETAPRPRRQTVARKPVAKTASPLPPGHVRKKATGEIGKIKAVDPKAGTATVFWLKRGAASTVPLSAVSRR